MRSRTGMGLLALLLAALATQAPQAAAAQVYPALPIMTVVPWPAGGLTDIIMRAMAEAAAKRAALARLGLTKKD